jgi:hypothetical protein
LKVVRSVCSNDGRHQQDSKCSIAAKIGLGPARMLSLDSPDVGAFADEQVDDRLVVEQRGLSVERGE